VTAFLLVALLVGVGFAAGYYHRDVISRRRHERARKLRNGEIADNDRPLKTKGDLGAMLDRWMDR
jgi:hypothetical protein